MPGFKLLSAVGDHAIDLETAVRRVVGRAVTSDLPIHDPTVSRRHAEVVATGEGVRVRDLGSSNGTYLNGEPVTVAMAGEGDTVTFGAVAFRVAVAAGPAAAAGARAAGDGGRAGAGETLGATILHEIPVPEAVRLSDRLRVPLGDGGDGSGEEGDGPLEPAPPEPGVDPPRAGRLALLLEISKDLSRHQDVNRLLERVVEITFQVMAVDRVSLLMLEPGSGELVPRVSRDRLGGAGSSRHVPQSIARRVVAERLAILTGNALDDERFTGESILLQSIRSAMGAPLLGLDGAVLGLIYVDNLTATDSFDDDDLEFLVAFAGLAAVAIENSRLNARVRREAVTLSNFQRYFAPELAREITERRDAVRLGGSKCLAVVFFSDIRGFTEIAERMRPDEIATLLSEYFTEMVEIVFAHGGTLDKFIGDALMAVWGAPIHHPDDAERAIRAALEMEGVLEELNAEWSAEGRPRLEIGIGINLGEVFAGNIGSDRRLEYTVIGDAVNVASRLCAEAGAGEILISESLYRALGEPPPAEPLAPLRLKGKARAVAVFRVER